MKSNKIIVLPLTEQEQKLLCKAIGKEHNLDEHIAQKYFDIIMKYTIEVSELIKQQCMYLEFETGCGYSKTRYVNVKPYICPYCGKQINYGQYE